MTLRSGCQKFRPEIRDYEVCEKPQAPRTAHLLTRVFLFGVVKGTYTNVARARAEQHPVNSYARALCCRFVELRMICDSRAVIFRGYHYGPVGERKSSVRTEGDRTVGSPN